MKREILKHVRATRYVNHTEYERNVLLVLLEDGSYEVNVSTFTKGKTDSLRANTWRTNTCANLDEAATLFNRIGIELVTDLSFAEDYE